MRVVLPSLFLMALVMRAVSFPPVPDTPFTQEYREEVSYPAGDKAKQVRALAVTGDGNLWVATKGGLYRWSGGTWKLELEGSAYAVAAWANEVWVGNWNGLYRVQGGHAEKMDSVTGPVVALWVDSVGVVAASQGAIYESDGAHWHSHAWTGARSIRSVARDANGGLWVATAMGAYYRDADSLREIYKEADLLTGELRAVNIAANGDVWLGGLGGIDVYRAGRRAESFNSKNGLPNQDVRLFRDEPDGTVWVGTALGAVRRIGSGWSLRHSRRWLPSDEVLAFALGPDRTMWVATTSGLSAIHRKQMTLAEKASHYLDICLARHVRAPYLVEQCDLKASGDTAHFAPRDDDNEGGYTGVYLAMESFRYAVTKDPQARENGHKAFLAMKFLQEVTGTEGFFARTVVPATWTKVHDANETFTPEERADRLVENPRAKLIENRWRLSADKKWLWKGDTSSDETSAHLFGYLTYYNLAADDTEKQLIREHVRRIVDHIVAGGYTFRDIDNEPTLWGVWSPEKLQHDPDWRAEQWTNGLEMLAYLRVAEYMTGNKKYRQAHLDLLEKDHYDRYARHPLATEPSERTNFDQELVAMVLPLAFTEEDPKLRAMYGEGLALWREWTKAQLSPYFSFTWAALAQPTNAQDIPLDRCVEFLRDEPLDLVQWTVDNRTREDVRLVHSPVLEDLQVNRILPPSERGTMRWDGNPFSAVRGEDGMSESSGVFWLLPYWMGRYYGFIAAPGH